MAIRSWVRWSSLMLVPRIPFVNAITLLMLVGEKTDNHGNVPFNTKVIYVQVAMSFLCGVLMSLNKCKKEAALIYSGQVVYYVFTIYNNEKLGYNDSLKLRIIVRSFGVVGVCLLYAHIASLKRGSDQLKKAGETVLGAFAICYTYSLLNSPDDREGFVRLIPGGEVSLFIAASFLGGLGMCFLSSYFIRDIALIMSVILTIITLFNDMDFKYWTKRRGLDYWVHVRLVCDHVTIIVGLLMIWSIYRNRLKVSDKEVKEKTY